MIFTAFRATVIVFGINALASLFSQVVNGQGIQTWFLLHQQQLPGAILISSSISAFGYAFCALVVCWTVARGYWWQLFPDRIHWKALGVSLGAGLALALLVNHSVHVVLFDHFFGKIYFGSGQVSDGVLTTIFDRLPHATPLFTLPFYASAIAAPFIEELTDRGILFKEAERLPQWFVAALSVVVFCAAHVAAGGIAKSLALIPAALLFTSLRLWGGSFIYSTAAHIALNTAALLSWRIW